MVAAGVAAPVRGASRMAAIVLLTRSHHALVPLDADADDLVGIALPPVFGGENLDIAVPCIARILDQSAQAREVDDAVAGHAAVEHEIARGHEPIADVIGQDAPGAARDLPRQIRVPPDMIGVDRDTDAFAQLL